MRPSVLTPLFASAQGAGRRRPRVLLLLKKALSLPPGITEPRVIDLLWHPPTGVIDRRAEPTVAGAVPGTIATFAVRVLKHKGPLAGNMRAPYRVSCEDETGQIDLVFFHVERKFIERQLPVGSIRYISGRVELYGDTLQMAHPDYIVPPEARADLPMLEPVHPLTAGLSGKFLLKLMRQVLERVPHLPEWQEPNWLAARGWPSFREAATRLHAPQESDRRPRQARRTGSGSPMTSYWAGQVALALVRPKLQGTARPGHYRRRPHQEGPHRSAALRTDGIAGPGPPRDRSGYGRAAAHAAPAAGRRRLGQDRGGALVHGHRRRSRRSGCPDGPHRSAGATARGNYRTAGG